MKKKQAIKDNHIEISPFEKTLNKFLFEIKSLNHTLPVLENFLITEFNKQEKEVKKLEPILKKQLSQQILDLQTINKYKQHREKRSDILHTSHSIRENFLISFITHFDTFLAGLLRSIYQINPQLLSINDENSPTDKSINYSKIMTYKSIDEIKEYIISQEIDQLLRGSMKKCFLYLEKRSNVALIKNISRWDELVEIDERRNIFVHSDGKVSEQYIQTCQKFISIKSKVKVGDQLLINEEDIKNAYECLTEVSIIASQLIRRKSQPKSLSQADHDFQNLTYKLLEQAEYDLVKRILDFGQKNFDKHSSEDFRLSIIINKAIACKFQNNVKECEELLNAEDWSAKDDTYKLAVLVLKEKYKEASKLMLTIHSSKISKEYYQMWPLFYEFRQTQDFLKSYRKIFKEIYKPMQSESILQ